MFLFFFSFIAPNTFGECSIYPPISHYGRNSQYIESLYFPPNLKVISDSEGGRPGTISDSDMSGVC